MNAVIVVLSNNKKQLQRLMQTCGNIKLRIFDGNNPELQYISKVYNQALDEEAADFYFFCHQDIVGGVQRFIEYAYDFSNKEDVVGIVGKLGNKEVWGKDIKDIIEVEILDECGFGFWRDSGYRFDEKLRWTNYSQDICLQAKKAGGKSLVIPTNIDHISTNQQWFWDEGWFAKELYYLYHKWGRFNRT